MDGLEEAILLIRTLWKLDSDTKIWLLFSSQHGLIVFGKQKENKVDKKKKKKVPLCFGHIYEDRFFEKKKKKKEIA